MKHLLLLGVLVIASANALAAPDEELLGKSRGSSAEMAQRPFRA